MTEFLRIHHVSLLVADCQRALMFYRDVLGLERIEGDDRLFRVSLTTAKRLLTRLWAESG